MIKKWLHDVCLYIRTMNKKEQEILLKIERFCVYRERCQQEVKDKLRKLGATEQALNNMLSYLEENDFVNEVRFAKLFAIGKFRIKRWGKIKIRTELRKKNIPFNLIEEALNEIKQEEYMKTLTYLAKKKKNQIKNKEYRIQKIGLFLLSKGFEQELIRKVLKTI